MEVTTAAGDWFRLEPIPNAQAKSVDPVADFPRPRIEPARGRFIPLNQKDRLNDSQSHNVAPVRYFHRSGRAYNSHRPTGANGPIHE